MLLRVNSSKKKILILVASVIFVIGLLVAAAFWLKASAESGAVKSIEKAEADTKASVKTLNAKLADKGLSVNDRINAFGALEEAVGNIDANTCKTESKNVMFGLSGAKSRCDDAHKKIPLVKEAAQNIKEGAKDDQALAAVLAPIKSADATDPAKQLEAWSTVAASVSKANVSQDSLGVKNHLMAVATSYRDAWKELEEANKAQNKANYEAAVKKIDAAKDELTKVATDQTAAFKRSLAEFKKAVSSL